MNVITTTDFVHEYGHGNLLRVPVPLQHNLVSINVDTVNHVV
jgi:hypothetical protein